MHVLILGGSPHHAGGIEGFCSRATEALDREHRHRIEIVHTYTAYLRLARLGPVMRSMSRLAAYRRAPPDCVWLQYGTLPDLTFLLVAKALRLTVMVTPHLGSNWRSQQNPVLRAIGAWTLARADRIALLSRTQEMEIPIPPRVPRSYIRTFLPRAIWETAAPALGDRVTSTMQLVHAGRLSAGKGTFLFVEVCRQLRTAGVPFVANIAGGADAATLQRLNQLIDDYALRDSVRVLGHLADVPLRDLLRASDALIHLSKIDSYPLIVLECLAYGVLPICMDLAGARDMVATYDGHIVSEAAAVSETVAFLTSEHLTSLRRRSITAATRVRADYRWDACAASVEAALSATVSCTIAAAVA